MTLLFHSVNPAAKGNLTYEEFEALSQNSRADKSKFNLQFTFPGVVYRQMIKKMENHMERDTFVNLKFYQLLYLLLNRGERETILEEIFEEKQSYSAKSDMELFRKLFHLNQSKLESKLNLSQKVKE